MRRLSLSAIIALMALGIMSPGTFAQMGPPPGPPGPPPPIALILQGVDLSAEQQAEVKSIMDSHRQVIEPLREQLHVAHQQLMSKLLSSGQVTVSELTPLEQQSGQVEQQIHQEMLKAAVEVRAVLTPDQLAKAAQINQKMDQIHGEMHDLMASHAPPEADAP
jgi:periplasmic protein CpxP/Spy